MCSLVHGRAVNHEGFGILIRSPVLIWDCVKNGVSLIFESLEDVLGIILVFEADEPIINNGENTQK